MIITKEIFDTIEEGEIFRVVITKYQNVYRPGNFTVKFVAVKGGVDWAIYVDAVHMTPHEVAKGGAKICDEANIRSICPCDDEVFKLYRI